MLAVIAGLYVLMPHSLVFGFDAGFAMRLMRRSADMSESDFLESMIVSLDERRIENAPAIRRLKIAFTAMLCGMLLAVCGLAAAVAIA